MDLVIIIVFLVVGLGGLTIAFINDFDVAFLSCVGSTFLTITLVILIDYASYPSPQPIDVYKGKTTLEITYKDSVAVDTVVVWKDEFDPKKKK